MTATQANIGIQRHFPTLGARNFESSGTQYACNYSHGGRGMWFMGTVYHVGDTLPYDVGGTSYSTSAVVLLRNYWEQGWITPLS
jgi:hypothetical protein